MALLPFDTPNRWTREAIQRADARAQDRGLFAYVASRAALGALGGDEFYRYQLRTMLAEAIYDFVFSARRAIECVDTVEPGLIDVTRGLNLQRAGWVFRSSDIRGELPLCDRDYWWVLNRIVHSRQMVVLPHGGEVCPPDRDEAAREWRRLPGDLSILAVRSDRDSLDEMSWVLVEDLLVGYFDEVSKGVRAISNKLTLAELGVDSNTVGSDEPKRGVDGGRERTS